MCVCVYLLFTYVLSFTFWNKGNKISTLFLQIIFFLMLVHNFIHLKKKKWTTTNNNNNYEYTFLSFSFVVVILRSSLLFLFRNETETDLVMVINYEDFSISTSLIMLSVGKIFLHYPEQFGFHPRI